MNLLPCPFCGPQVDDDKEPLLYAATARDGYVLGHTVLCQVCGVEVQGKREADAAVAWNTRHGVRPPL